MKFQLFPYTEIDGIKTASDSVVRNLFKRTMADGLDKIVFYEGGIQTEDEFLSMAKGNVLFYFLMDDNKAIGYMWLNRFENHTARQHYCVFKEYWGHTIDIGKFTLRTLLNMKDKDDNFVFDLLTGFVPAWNKKAISFSLKCGGKSLGTVPNAIWNCDKQQSEDAVFIYYTREVSHDSQ